MDSEGTFKADRGSCSRDIGHRGAETRPTAPAPESASQGNWHLRGGSFRTQRVGLAGGIIKKSRPGGTARKREWILKVCENYIITDVEAMQVAKECIHGLDVLEYLIQQNIDLDTSFFEAQIIAIKQFREMGDEEYQALQGCKDKPLEYQIEDCFPQLTYQDIVSILRWKRKIDNMEARREFGRHHRRRERNKDKLWLFFGEAYYMAEKLVSQTRSEQEKNRIFEDEREAMREFCMEHEKILAAERVFQHMINKRCSSRRFNLPIRVSSYTPRTSSYSRSRRSPVRSAAKSGDDDGGGDGDSDGPGDPPRPRHISVPSHRHYSLTRRSQRNRFPLSWRSSPSSWRVERGCRG